MFSCERKVLSNGISHDEGNWMVRLPICRSTKQFDRINVIKKVKLADMMFDVKIQEIEGK